MNTEKRSTPLTQLVEQIEVYFKSTSELLKLQALQKSSDSIAGLISIAILAILFLHFFIFFNLGIAVWISNLLGSFTKGFLLFSAFYALVFMTLYFKKEEWIIIPVKEKIAEEALNEYTEKTVESDSESNIPSA